MRKSNNTQLDRLIDGEVLTDNELKNLHFDLKIAINSLKELGVSVYSTRYYLQVRRDSVEKVLFERGLIL